VNAADGADRARAMAAEAVRAEIAAHGPMTFARFMEVALYAPGVGYYPTRTAEDFCQDYVTSPEVHPAFGVLLCGQLEEMWRLLGAAAESFPDFSRALRLALIEGSDGLRAAQQARLAPWADAVAWLDLERNPASRGVGCVFANELLDAFPAHRVVMREDGLHETFVSLDGVGFADVDDLPSTPTLAEQIRAGGGRLRPGDRGEVNLAAPRWVSSAAALLDRGYLLLLDYGEPADLLYGERHPRGTLRCYSRHTMNEMPYDRVSQQDITAHVDLSAVARASADAGFGLIGATHQAKLLERLGMASLRYRIDKEIPARIERRAHHAALDLLSDSRQLGRVSVLLMGKGVASEPPTGFVDGAQLAPPRSDHVLELRLKDALRLAEALRSSATEPAGAPQRA